MSFPGGSRGPPPMGMMPQGYPGMGVMGQGVGVPVGMPPNLMPPMGGRSRPQFSQKFQPKNQAPVEDKPSTITVFVGNITERASDGLIRAVLGKCGYIANWKRAHGADGILQGFGFCEYSDPNAALRAIRVLNEMEIGDKKLMVKADAKTKEMLAKFEAEERKVSDYDSFCKRADIDLGEQVQQMLRVHANELRNKGPIEKPDKERAPRNKAPVQDSMDDMELDEEKKSLITREIDKFRDTYKREEEETTSSSRRDDKRRRSPSPGRKRDRRRSRSPKPRSPRRSPDRPKKSDKSSDRKPIGQKSNADDDEERYQKELRDRAKERERDMSRMERDKRRDDVKDDEMDEELYERRRHEKRLREKEAAYQEHLKQWEGREKRRAKEYLKEVEKEEERIDDEQKEARRLREFFEDYDDERDDPKYYAGSSLTRRLRDRQREAEWDQRDRQKEKEEFEELKKKLLEEGHPDPEGEAEKRLLPPNQRDTEVDGAQTVDSENVSEEKTPPRLVPRVLRDKNGQAGPAFEERPPREARPTVERVKESKRRHIKAIVEKIPNTKDELFAYVFDRNLIDEALVERRLRPWINKKILEYIGDEEAALVDFICQKIQSGADPVELLSNVSTVLDDDAENFIIKLWRLLIYEIEDRKMSATTDEAPEEAATEAS